jgi:hypothetical protein
MVGASHAFLGRADLPGGDEVFTHSALLRGVSATATQCASIANAIWAQPMGESGECLRYWHAGFEGKSQQPVLLFFPPDLLAGNELVNTGYTSLSPAKMQVSVDNVAARMGVRYVFFSRPGTYGSSGEHLQRRRIAESRLISAAMDELKKRYDIGAFVVSGLSGGGHVVASLLTYRSDIVCAVPSSAVSAPRLRWQLKGLSRDTTGYSDSYEPTENLVLSRMNPNLRVFVLGDLLDSNTPWASQTVLAEKLRAVGVAVELLNGEGAGAEHHGLSASAVAVGAACAKGQSTEQILQFAARGLRG